MSKYRKLIGNVFFSFVAIIVVGALVLLTMSSFNRFHNKGTEITKSHLSQLTYVIDTMAPFCGDEYLIEYKTMSKNGLDPDEILYLLDLSIFDYRKDAWTDRSGREPVERFALNELPCVYLRHSKSLSELTAELYTHQYKEVSEMVGALDSPELNNTVNRLFKKGHLTFLDKFIIEQSHGRITKQRLINSLKASVSQ